MDSTSVLRWNKNEFLPDVRMVQDDFTIRLLRWPRGIFLLKKWQIDETKFLLAVVPFQNRYKINNRYLISGWNKKLFPTQEIAINDGAGEGFPFMWNGRTIFKLAIAKTSVTDSGVSEIELILTVTGIIILIFGIYSLVRVFHGSGQHEWAIVILTFFFVGGRILMLTLFSSPNFPLFDPAYFASSAYNRSIGDLLLNTIAIVIPIVYLFYNFSHFKFLKIILSQKHWKMWLV
jgi:hypothetical protein